VFRIFRAHRGVDAKAFAKFSGSSNRLLLWHAAPLPAWPGILSQGLRPAPAESPYAFRRLGRGLYFTDMVARAVQDCQLSEVNTSETGGTFSEASHCRRIVLLLAEVALDRSRELDAPDIQAEKRATGVYGSTLGRGAQIPNGARAWPLLDKTGAESGVRIPLGPAERRSSHTVWTHNEYVVHKPERAIMRYLVELQVFPAGSADAEAAVDADVAAAADFEATEAVAAAARDIAAKEAANDAVAKAAEAAVSEATEEEPPPEKKRRLRGKQS